jgi:hypothetical protein
MSAKSVEITQRTPKSNSAQGACSRDEPQPKTRDQNNRLSVSGPVEDEVRVFRAVVAIAQFGEEVWLEQGRDVSALGAAT